MKVQRGDRVRFLNEVGGGIVSRIEGSLVFVEDDDGFEMPVPVFEIVVIEKVTENIDPAVVTGQLTGVGSKNNLVSEKEPSGAILEDEGHDDFNPRFYIAFLNTGKFIDENSILNVYLINDSNYYCTYLLSGLGTDGYMHALFQGTIEPNTKLLLKEYPAREMDANWEVQMLLYKMGRPYPALTPVSSSVKLKAKRFMKGNVFTGNDFFHQPAVLIPVIKNELEQKLDLILDFDAQAVIKVKETKSFQNSAVKRVSTPELLEIDLHVHELLDNWDNLSSGEILQVQIDKFHSVMVSNLHNKGRRVVFIHGVGNGTLKTELRVQLDKKYKGFDYQDASFREYGYGATMVIIK